MRAKAQEELDEILVAEGDAVGEEIADLYEVLLALAENAGIESGTILRAAEHKRDKHGAFQKRIWLSAE